MNAASQALLNVGVILVVPMSLVAVWNLFKRLVGDS
jgi:hypothetical protein